MKKIFQITVIMLSALVVTNFAQAQSAIPTPVTPAKGPTDKVELNVILKPIQTLKVNGTAVNLVYESEANYKDGVTKEIDNQLTVYSIGAFNVTVKSTTDDIGNTKSASETIASSGIKIKAGKGSLNSLDYGFPVVELSTEAAEIITSAQGVVNKNFNITYKGDGGESYISKYFKANGGESVYNTTVTYTIAAQ